MNMREMSINSQGGSTSLVLKLNENDRLDRLAMGMITNNKIPGLLSVSPRRVNQDYYLYYGISSLTPLRSAYGALSSDKRLLLFLRSLCRLAAECHEYLLDESGILLDPEYVYVQLSSGEIQAAYLPLEGERCETTLFQFVRALVMAVSSNFAPDSKLMAVLYRMVLAEDQFSAAALDEQLSRLQTEGAVQTDKASAAGAVRSPGVYAARREEPAVQAPVYAAPQVKESAPAPVSTEKKAAEDANSVMQKFFGSKAQAEKPAKEPKPAKEKPAKPQKAVKASFGNMAIPGMETPVETAEEPENVPEESVAVSQKKSRFNLFQKKAPAAEPQAPAAPAQPVVRQEASRPVQQTMGGGYTCNLESMEHGTPATTALVMDAPADGLKSLWLVRRATGQRVQVTHGNFHIGRGQGLVDFYISTSAPYIGVDHAYIQIQGGQYFFVDNNSLNHSWLNGALLEGSRPYPIQGGDQLRLADEYFDVISG